MEQEDQWLYAVLYRHVKCLLVFVEEAFRLGYGLKFVWLAYYFFVSDVTEVLAIELSTEGHCLLKVDLVVFRKIRTTFRLLMLLYLLGKHYFWLAKPMANGLSIFLD